MTRIGSALFGILLCFAASLTGCHFGGYGDYPPTGAGTSTAGTGVISGSVTASGAIALSRLSCPDLRPSVRISSASVWLQDTPSIASVTDANGLFTLFGVPFGSNHRVIARFQLRDNTGRLVTYKVRSPALPVTDSTPVRSDANLDLQLASSTVSGILRDTQGNPVPFATLEVWGESFQTDGQGRFEAPPLPPPAATETAIETITIKTGGFSTTPITTTFGPPGTTFIEVTVPKTAEPNQPPRIMLFRESADSVRAGGQTTLWAVFLDPDGIPADLQPILWDLSDGIAASSTAAFPTSLKPAFDQFLSVTGLSSDKVGVTAISWTAPQEEGYQAITARVRDGSGVEARAMLRIPVANPLAPPPPLPVNRPPVPTISATGTAPAGGSVTLEALPNDPDGNFGMTFAWSISPTAGAFSSEKAGRTTWTAPTATGTYVFTCTVTDPSGASGKATHNLIVYPASTAAPLPPNQPPAPRISSLRTVTVGKSLGLAAIPNDPDGATGLTYAWTTDPVGGVFSDASAQVSTWTAPLATGVYTIRCTVSDGQYAVSATQTVTVISDLPVSAPRRISGYVRDQTTDAPISGALVVIRGTDRYAITDADGYFLFTEVPAGTYTLLATRDGYQGRTFTGIIVPAT